MVPEIKGIGEEVPLFRSYTIHDGFRSSRLMKIPVRQRTFFRNLRLGLAGDGIVAVLPMDHAVGV